MTSYFDPTSTADKNMLPPSVRNNVELINVAVIAEADVIGYYTSDPPYYLYTAFLTYLQSSGKPAGASSVGLWGGFFSERGLGEDISNQSAPSGAVVPQLRVYLRGYKADASHANTDPNLKLALKRTIAEVIEWRINKWTVVEPGVASSTGTDGTMPRTKIFRPTAEDAFPPDWTRRLDRFGSSPVAWAM